MSGTTTIEISEEQKDELDAFKLTDSEPYKSVLQRLIDGYNGSEAGDALTEEDVEAIVDRKIEQLKRELAGR